MSSSLATQPFRHAGLPDVTIKGLGTVLRTLSLFDTNKAFLRITDQPDRFSFKIDGTSKASSTLPASNTSNLETLTGIQAVQSLADSTRAIGVAEIRYDPNGIRQCGEAEKYRRDALTRVTFLLYADHVSEHLEKCKMPPLRSLARYDGFPKAFVESLSSEDSIDDMTEHMGLGEATWIEASLFLVQYFNQPERPQILSSNDIWKSPVGDIALKCIQQASGSPLAGRVALGALRALPVSYGILDNEAFRPPVGEEVLGLLQNMPFHPESGTKAEEILRQIQDLGGAEGWQSHTHELTVLWAKQQQIFSEEAENLARSVDTVPHSMISWQDLAADPLLHALLLRVQAMPIIHYLKNCASADFIVQRPGRLSQYKHQPPSNNGPGTCFVAGTRIITKSGNKPIEDLEENDWVLTNGANDEWGLVSDERVVIPVDSPIIYGFNDEAPFFTAGHVFHTTTGLRALDAELAMKENPWAEVGRLSAGHILYRLGKDGRTYDQVPILDINWRQMPEVTEVYGVHLREGRRSYHANDYLVMVNYPEITLKRICSTLATFSQEDQVRLLQSLKELNPLFERFGIATVSEMVQREVDAAKNNLTARMYNVTENKLAGLAHASVCFNPEEIPTVDYSQLPYALPVVTLFDGVILVNGVVCEYGRVDNANSEVRWSRFISQNMVEHGVLSIQDPRYHSGIGQICYSTDYDGDDLLELPVFQYMTYGSECELEMDALSAGVTKQELIS
ncbi:Guanine nucleotide exchange factor SRM1 [Fusarium oxysporum f. sp. albedinis]|nr:Guanine nucleotide exchange factor SRM1 [Fusarium oxysporum f. sp. albedinis]